ncbi:hypothetical protein PLICRDRAFT_39949 [Plicaturopsis crispa FD-325 SS-3]|nr:hypothetical protein PLICRDRAFT_39949 [Plicaturopsis crispa FD-325 SS-3]
MGCPAKYADYPTTCFTAQRLVHSLSFLLVPTHLGYPPVLRVLGHHQHRARAMKRWIENAICSYVPVSRTQSFHAVRTLRFTVLDIRRKARF